MKKFFAFLLGFLLVNSTHAFDFGDFDLTAAKGLKAAGELAKGRKKEKGSEFWESSRELKPETEYLRSVLKKLSPYSKYAHGVELIVFDSPRVQGLADLVFARIYVTRGMLNVISNEAALAAYLGHELGHIDLKHSGQGRKANSVGDAMKAGLELGGLADNKLSDEVLDQQYEIARSGWGKELEAEADKYGVEIAAKAGYNPMAFKELFLTLSQGVADDFFYSLKKIKGSHASLLQRANAIEKHIAAMGGEGARGELGTERYQEALSSLESYSADQDGPSIALRKDEQKIKKELDALKREILGKAQNKRTVDYARFAEIMNRLSVLSKRYGIGREDLNSPESAVAGESFMEEELNQDWPIWNGLRGGLSDKNRELVLDLLGAIGGIGVGMVPVVGDAIDAYEALTGTSFFDGTDLSKAQRTLAALGVIVGSGAAWREAAKGLELGIDALGNGARKSIRLSKSSDTQAIGEALSVWKSGENWVPRIAEEVNEKWLREPRGQIAFARGKYVMEGILKEDKNFFRLYNGIDPKGDWLIDFDPRRFSSKELKDMVALPKFPDSVAQVKVPKGTKVLVGISGTNDFGRGGTVQWFMEDGWKLSGANFSMLGKIE